MSDPLADDLSARLLGLLSDFLADNGGGMVEGFALAADFLDGDGEPQSAVVFAPGQRATQSAGLARVLTKSTDEDIASWIGDARDD